MGGFLGTPKTEKELENGSCAGMRFGAAAMQGWRVEMEDAHCAQDVADGVAFFGVFDGHGGSEVAKYAARHIPQLLREMPEFQRQEFSVALRKVFLRVDELIATEEGRRELKALAGTDDAMPAEADEAEKLTEESTLPIKNLLERYNIHIQNSEALKLCFVRDQDEEGAGNMEQESSSDEDFSPRSRTLEKYKEDALENDSSEAAAGAATSEGAGESAGEGVSAGQGRKGKLRKTKDAPKTVAEESDESEAPATAKAAHPKKKKKGSWEMDADESVDQEQASPSAAPASNAAPAAAAPAAASGEEAEESEAASTSDSDEDKPTGGESGEGDEEAEIGDEEGDWTTESSEDDERSLPLDPRAKRAARRARFMRHEVESPTGEGVMSGCTAVGVIVSPTDIFVANAGDSRCIMSRDGVCLALSDDHKPENPTETARIRAAGGWVSRDGRVNDNLNLSRALGDLMYKKNASLPPEQQAITADPDIIRVPRSEADEFLVIACDGIWNSMDNQTVINFCRPRLLAGEAPEAVCAALCDACMAADMHASSDGSGCDNETAMIVLLKPFARTASAAATPPQPKRRATDPDPAGNPPEPVLESV